MSVQDIVNSQGLSLDNTDPLSVMSNGQATPSQIKELYESAQQEQDWKGATDLSVVNPDTLNTGVDIGKARAEFQRNGLPEGIEKPSKWGKLEDMLGSLLVGVALSALLGMDGKGAIGVGLMAAGSALDLDNAKAQRYDSIMSMDRTGINPAALVDYYNTGNLKGLQYYEDERNKREDAAQALQDKETYAQWEDQNILQPREERQHGYRMQEIAARPIGRLGGLSESTISANTLSPESDDTEYDKQMKRNIAIKQATNKPLSVSELAYLDSKSNPKVSGGLINLGNADMHDKISMQKTISNYRTHNQTMSNLAQKTNAAEARLNAVDMSMPIGQLAGEYQFLTVEAPTIGNSVAVASGVSQETVDGYQDKLNQLIQKWQMKGSLTPQEASELKSTAKAEADALRKVKETQDLLFAQDYDLSDPQTRSAIEAATDLTADDIAKIQKQQQALKTNAVSVFAPASGKTVDFSTLPK